MANQNGKRSGSSNSDDDGKRSNDVPARSKEDMQERLGLGLKKMYLSVLEEPLPDDMLSLLDQLDDNNFDQNNGRPDLDE